MIRWGGAVAGLGVVLACGPSSGEQDGGGADDESTTREPTTQSEGSSNPGDGGETSGHADTSTSGVSTSGAETSIGDGESSSTTAQMFECDCAPDEVCYQQSTDHCLPGERPETFCIETPATCEGMEPTCDGECGWEICGGPYCSGPHESFCDYITPGFVCGPGLLGPCNIFTQDCDKCVSFDAISSGEYTTTLCAGTKPPTVGVGEACVVEHGNGYDNCPAGSMCVADPPTALTGICREACVGNPWNASCTDPGMQCVVDGWWFAWCFPK